MKTALKDLIDVYESTTGRQLLAYAKLQKLDGPPMFKRLADHLTLAVAGGNEVLELELRWAQSKSKAVEPSPTTQKLDWQIDRTLSAIYNITQELIRSEDPDDPIVAKANTFLFAILPQGVQAVTKLVYADELAAVDVIVKKLKSDELAPLVDELGVGRQAKRLEKLAEEFRNSLEADKPVAVGWDQVRAARAEAQERLLQTIAIILGEHPYSTEADVAARETLLRPILEQDEAIGEYLRARRPVRDVNPETGEELPASAPEQPAEA